MLRQALNCVIVFVSLVTGCAIQEPVPQPVVVDVLVDSTSVVGVDERVLAAQLDACLPVVGVRPGSSVRVWLLGASPSATRIVAQVRFLLPSTASARSRHRATRAFIVEARAALLRDVVPALREKPLASSPIAEALAVLAAADTPSGAERAIVVLSDFVQHSGLGHFDAAIPKHDRWFAALDRERVLLPGSLRGISVRCAFFKPLPSLRATEELRHLWSATLERAGATVDFTSGPAVFPVPHGDVSLLFVPVGFLLWRVRRMGRADAGSGLPNRRDAVVLATLGVPRSASLGAAPVETRALRSQVERLWARVCGFWWAPFAFLLLMPLALYVDARALVRVLLVLGLSLADALSLGCALAIVLVGVTALVGAACRVRRLGYRLLALAGSVLLYLLIVGSLAVLRFQLVDPGEDRMVAYSSALLLLASTAAPSAALEYLVRQAFTVIPAGLAWWTALRRLQHAIRENARLEQQQAKSDAWSALASRLGTTYDLSYERAQAQGGKS